MTRTPRNGIARQLAKYALIAASLVSSMAWATSVTLNNIPSDTSDRSVGSQELSFTDPNGNIFTNTSCALSTQSPVTIAPYDTSGTLYYVYTATLGTDTSFDDGGGSIYLRNIGSQNFANIFHGPINVTGNLISYNGSSGNLLNVITRGGLNASENGQAHLSFSTNTITGNISVSDTATASLNSSTNTITGNINASGSGYAYLSSSTNSITGDINTSGDGYAELTSSTNTINGNISISDSAGFLNNSSSNTINGNITVSGNGFADLSSSTNNTITGNISVSDSAIAYLNSSSTNTITSVTLNATPHWIDIGWYDQGNLQLGGGGSTSNIGTFDWQSGALTMCYNGGSFGTNHIDTLNIGTGNNIILYMYNIDSSAELSFTPSSTTLFTVNTVIGDAGKIILRNDSPFTEVFPTPTSPNGIYADGTTLYVNMVRAETATESGEISALSTVSETSAVQNLTTQMQSEFTSSSGTTHWNKARQYNRLRQTLNQNRRQNAQDRFEAVVNTLRDNGTEFVKFKGDTRLWAVPYATYIKNKGAGGFKDGFSEKYYGIVVGGSQYDKKSNTNFNGMIGVGGSKTQMERSKKSYTHGRSIMAGLGIRKQIKGNIDVESNLMGMVNFKDQQREGKPSPTQKYLAKAKFKTYNISWRSEAGPVIKFDHGISIKPNIGAQLDAAKRSKIKERNAGTFAQNYKSKITKSAEIYGGIGIRKVIKTDTWESKITLKYEIGQKTGPKKNKTIAYNTAGVGTTITSEPAGNFTQYVSLYGSAYHKKAHWKIVPGIQMAIQKLQRIYTAAIKFEYRW